MVLLLTGIVLIVCAGPAAALQTSAKSNNYNVLILTPGHSQTITFALNDVIFNDLNAFHACYILWLGEGSISARVGTASAVGEFSGVVFSTLGFIGLEPVFDYAYDAESITMSIDVPAFGVGILFTGITTGIGNPDFPIIMSMAVSHPG